jgi:hypothetical protein
LRVQRQPGLHSEFEAYIGYTARPCIKQTNKIHLAGRVTKVGKLLLSKHQVLSLTPSTDFFLNPIPIITGTAGRMLRLFVLLIGKMWIM